MKNNQKGFTNVSLIIVVVALVAIGGYFVLSKKSIIPSETQQTQTPNDVQEGDKIDTPPITTTSLDKITTPDKILKVAIGLISKQFSPDFYPKVSADGSKIVFWKRGEGKPEEKGLWVINVDGTEMKQLIKDDLIGTGDSFEWSPITDTHYNDRYVFYIAQKEIPTQTKFSSTTHVLKVVNQDGNYSKELTPNSERVAFPRWISINEIAYIDKNDDNKLKIVDINGKKVIRSSDEMALVYGEYRDKSLSHGVIKSITFNGVVKQLIPDNDNGVFPVLSPDKKKVVYTSFWSGPQKIMVMNIDGSNKIQVASGSFPSWSFDSSRIAYYITEEDGYNVTASDIYVVNADGSGNKKVETGIEKGPALNPRWFPDGKHIVLDYSDKGVGTIEIVPVE
ncbi:MAG: hypothetical protein WCT44_00320 [Candidatus Paceibacterota bacterium]